MAYQSFELPRRSSARRQVSAIRLARSVAVSRTLERRAQNALRAADDDWHKAQCPPLSPAGYDQADKESYRQRMQGGLAHQPSNSVRGKPYGDRGRSVAVDDLNAFGSFGVFRFPLQFPLSLMIELLIPALRFSSFLPKSIRAANNIHSGGLFHCGLSLTRSRIRRPIV